VDSIFLFTQPGRPRPGPTEESYTGLHLP